MHGLAEAAQMPFASEMNRAAALLGGPRILKHMPGNGLDIHELLLLGLPGEALNQLERRLQVLDAAALEKAIGMSLRTLQRRRADPSQPLSVEQSGRVWKFAEILAKATEVMGGQRHAEEWLGEPAIGLNGRKPIDLLTTAAGAELVERFLGQIEYGVYV
ncbi:antitoxin Xre/MbcA/ParS toxin-binding domain-containing protein [Devosia sp. 2618]|uniref:type II RES/Xre toxin-antitoxin system antitoxin n=1 Tax=Devosia sp. 2618 TaxID=3156454 RepID=UPI003393F994